MREIETIRYESEEEFMGHVNGRLGDGWEILSTSCSFANSEYDNFPSVWMAIMIKTDTPDLLP